MSQTYIVLAIMIFMAVMFVINKVKFGIVSMTCCVLLVVTGVMDIQTAFSGFANKTIILVAPMLALSQALTKTSLVPRIRVFLNEQQSKRGMLLIIFFYLVGAAFVQFIPATATIAIMFAFMETMDDSGEITPSRLLLPLLGVMQIWKGFIPIGIGATTFASVNAKYEGIIQNENMMLHMLDPFKVTILPVAVLTIYCLFAWRLMPRTTKTNKAALKEVKDQKPLDPAKEKIIYVVFAAVMACLVLNKFTGGFMYLAPATGLLILLYTGAFPVQDAVKALTADMIWMMAGVLTMASALGSSGAGELIGSAIIGLLGDHPSSYMITFTFTAVTIIMTSFISNTGCSNVLIPIAASIALAGNMDPRGLILAITIGCRLAIGFPSGSGEGAVTYAAGGYNPAKVAKFTIPYIVLAIIAVSVSCNFFFPVYG